MTDTDLVYSGSSLTQRKEYALALSNAGELVPDGFRNKDGSPNPAKLLLAFEYGAMLGLHPVAALQGINVIKGKASPAPSLMTALVRRAGHKLRVKQSGSWPETFKVTVIIVRTDDPSNPFEATWDEGKARRAKLWPASGDSSWAKYPEAMCMWRAVSEACRMGAEDVMFGAHYVPEELGATVNEAGEIVEDAEIVEQDHDGPNVQKVMRDPKTETGNAKVTFGRSGKTEVNTRPDEEHTRPDAQRPGVSRPASQPGTGHPDTDDSRDRAAIATMWTDHIRDTTTWDALLKLRTEVMAVGSTILEYQDTDGHTVADWFERRRLELTQDTTTEPAIDIHGELGVYEDDAVPF